LTETNTILVKTDEETLIGWLQSRLSEERFQHSLGAQKKAVELARYFKLPLSDVDKAGVAGLLHDAAKLLPPAALFEACQRFEIPLTQEEVASPQTLHPFVGAEMVRQDFGIVDEDILNAIRYHTTGRRGMTDVEKVVYIADKIEENTRNPLYTQKITALINSQEPQTLDKVVLYILDSTITFLIEKHQIIHPRTIDARNELVAKLKEHRPLRHQT
jgi:predicted HD superfamily hydrolase involved in NAD metabolism